MRKRLIGLLILGLLIVGVPATASAATPGDFEGDWTATDGLDVSSAYFGPNFPGGVFVAQDGRNITPDENQNFKLVPWQRISDAMGLE